MKMLEKPKIIQIIPAQNVRSVCRNDDGTEIKDKVHLIALRENGEVEFLECCVDGIFHCPNEISNFLRYEFS